MAATRTTVAEAEAEAQKAKALLEDLDARLLEGDEAVSPKAYEAARIAHEYAEKKLQGVRNREAREAEEQRLTAAQTLRSEMRSTFAETAPKVVTAYEAALAALGDLAQAVGAQNETRERFHARVAELHAPDHRTDSPFPKVVRDALDIGLGYEMPFVKLLPLVDAAIYQAFIPDHVQGMSHDETERVRSLAGPPVESVRVVRDLAEYLTSQSDGRSVHADA